MKDFFSILLLIVVAIAILVGVCLGIDYVTAIFNKQLNQSGYNNPGFHYRIDNVNELKIDVQHSSNGLFVQRFISDSAEVYVAAFKVRQDNPDSDIISRYNYRYAEKIDTICFPLLKQYVVTREEKPLYSWKITREYSYGETERAKTVTIFAREYIYLFFQQYETSSALLNRIEDDFTSSRTFCFQNIKDVWMDRIAVNTFMSFISSMLNFAWVLVCLIICLWLFIMISSHINNSIVFFTLITVLILLFSYLALHDSFMDWLMSYDTFLKIPLQLIEMFFGGD